MGGKGIPGAAEQGMGDVFALALVLARGAQQPLPPFAQVGALGRPVQGGSADQHHAQHALRGDVPCVRGGAQPGQHRGVVALGLGFPRQCVLLGRRGVAAKPGVRFGRA
ncbi:hypothetical protein D3C72_1934170 [compost metagenome]